MSTFSPQFLHSVTFLHVHELEMAVNADKTTVMIVAFLMSMKIHLCLCTLLCVALYNARKTEQIFFWNVQQNFGTEIALGNHYIFY